jgi:hypothetical protein
MNNETAVEDMWAAAEKLRAGDTDVPPRLVEATAGWMLLAAEKARSTWAPPLDRSAGWSAP